MNVGDVLNRRGDVAYVARAHLVHGHVPARTQRAQLGHFKVVVAGHHVYPVAHAHAAIHYAHIANRAAVVVVKRIEYQRGKRLIRVARGRGHALYYILQHVLNAYAHLGRNQRRVGGVQTDLVLYLAAHNLGLGAGQVDLVYYRQYLQIVFQRHVYVGQRLRLYALRRVHYQHRALARGQRAADLVGKVVVAGSVDQVEHIVLPVLGVIVQPYGFGLDRNSAFALQLHRVEHLFHHIALSHNAGLFQQPIGQRGLAMVNMGNNAEIANLR